MPKYHQDEVRRLMDDVTKVRNIAMLGTKDHGKSTLLDSVGATCGYLDKSKIGEALFTLYRADEREKKSNLKTNAVHTIVETKYQEIKVNKEGKDEREGEYKTDKFAMTFLDTPGHIEYSPEINAALRMCDSCVVTVGVTDGVSVILGYNIADAIKERVKPSLFVNKLDISIMTLERGPEELYQDIAKVLQSIEVCLAPAEKQKLTNYEVDPLLGNVIFGSAYYGWAFSVRQFAEMLEKQTGGKMEAAKLLPRMYGDQFYNAKKKVWTKVETEDSKRGMVQFILEPIVNLHKKMLAGDASWETMATKLGIDLKPEDKKLTGKALVKKVMSTWLPASNALLEMCATHGPNPKAAQGGGDKGHGNKIDCIYKGDPDSDLAKSMKACDPEGPLMIHAVKMIPTGSAGRFFALGRIFSGMVKTDKYHIRNPDYDPEDPETAACSQDGRVQSVNLCLGKDVVPVMNVPAGNIVALGGVDQFMSKMATITDNKHAYNFTNFSFMVSCVYKVSIKPLNGKELPKLVEGLKRLQKGDMLVRCSSEPTGDHIIETCGEEHMRMLLKDLKEEYAQVDFTKGMPTVQYKETVTCESYKTSLSKSPNKHNRLYVTACPMEEDVCQSIEKYEVTMQQEPKKRARLLIDNFGWDKTECMKIWSFGPNDLEVGGANVLIDCTKGIQYLNEIKESVNSGLQWAGRAGPLAEENMRGIRFNLLDVKLHADSIHRGMGQIQPTARRVFYGAALMADARFMEPIFRAVIACPEECVAGVNQSIMAKRGEVQHEEEADGRKIIHAFLPIAETLGNDPFSKVLQMKTSGKALATFAFDHWKLIQTNPLEVGSRAESIMLEIRERKGLKVEQPDLSDYVDRL